MPVLKPGGLAQVLNTPGCRVAWINSSHKLERRDLAESNRYYFAFGQPLILCRRMQGLSIESNQCRCVEQESGAIGMTKHPNNEGSIGGAPKATEEGLGIL